MRLEHRMNLISSPKRKLGLKLVGFTIRGSKQHRKLGLDVETSDESEE